MTLTASGLDMGAQGARPTAGAHIHPELLEVHLHDSMQIVEDRLRAAIRSDQSIITEMSGHLIAAGGKRIRPRLVLLGAQFGEASDPRVLTAAVVCELTHLASLYHDDVMDEATIRRGQQSPNLRWGNKMSIMTGDYLFAQAALLGAEIGVEFARSHSFMAKRLVGGQIREMVGPLPAQDPMKHYLRVTSDKTGALVSSACEIGARLAGAPDPVLTSMIEYGEALGMALQFSDDLLDITGEEAELQKSVGQDLRAGVMTLPILHVRAAARECDLELISLLDGDLHEDEEGAVRARLLLREHPALAAARQDLVDVVERAQKALEPLPDISARRLLSDIVARMLTRAY